MKHKITGLVVFLVLGCVLTAAGATTSICRWERARTNLSISRPRSSPPGTFANGKEATFEGNVKVNQGDVTLSCDQLVLVYDEKTGARTGEGRVKKLAKKLENVSQIKSITASGNVKIVQNERMAVAGKALYDNAKRTITLTEGPRLWQGADMMVAKTIIVYLDENRVDSQGGNENPIKFKINPEQQKKEKEK